MSWRIGILAIGHESHAFARGQTTLVDFRNGLLRCGAEMESEWKEGSQSPIAGAVEVFQGAGATIVPLIQAQTTPGPVISRETGEAIWNMLQERLNAVGNLDAIFVVPHGAAMEEAHPDFDGWWLGELRKRVGLKVPIAGVMDPHCNVTQAKIQAVDFLLPYKTNPHLDARERGAKAAKLLLRMLRDGFQPVQTFCMPPVLLNIECQHTGSEPLSLLCNACDDLEARDGILDASVVLGYPYTDLPEMGSGVQVVSENLETSRAAALEIARRLWEMRARFEPELISVHKAVEMASESPRPVCLPDMGDNIGGGASGSGTWLAHALNVRGDGNVFLCLCDPEAVEVAMRGGVGSRISIRLGAENEVEDGPPLDFQGTVVRFPEASYFDPEMRHGGRNTFFIGRSALLVSENGKFHILVTTLRASPNSPGLLTNAGLDPATFDIIVAKGVHGPLGALKGICRTFIKVDTRGTTSANPLSLPYRRRRRPMYPLERDISVDWEATCLSRIS